MGNVSWRVLNRHRSVQPQSFLAGGMPAPETPDEDYWLTVNGLRVSDTEPALAGADGTGLSADAEVFYFTALSATTVWSVPTAALRSGRKEIEADVSYVGNTRSAAGGIVSGDDGMLYLTALTNNSITRITPQSKQAPF